MRRATEQQELERATAADRIQRNCEDLGHSYTGALMVQQCFLVIYTCL